jgi:hypothetical protein
VKQIEHDLFANAHTKEEQDEVDNNLTGERKYFDTTYLRPYLRLRRNSSLDISQHGQWCVCKPPYPFSSKAEAAPIEEFLCKFKSDQEIKLFKGKWVCHLPWKI